MELTLKSEKIEAYCYSINIECMLFRHSNLSEELSEKKVIKL